MIVDVLWRELWREQGRGEEEEEEEEDEDRMKPKIAVINSTTDNTLHQSHSSYHTDSCLVRAVCTASPSAEWGVSRVRREPDLDGRYGGPAKRAERE